MTVKFANFRYTPNFLVHGSSPETPSPNVLHVKSHRRPILWQAAYREPADGNGFRPMRPAIS
jgi:hypothetical protein